MAKVIWTIYLRTVSGANAREHHYARARRVREERSIARGGWLRMGKPALPKPPCKVTITRISPRKLDNDNLGTALKGVRDEVAAILGVDDAPDLGVVWACEQRRPDKPNKHLVEIMIEDVDAD